MLEDLDATALRAAVDICTERYQLEERGEIDALRARYPGLRRYLPAFFALPFQGEPGSDALFQGLDLVRQRDAGTVKTLPRLAPPACGPRQLWPALSATDDTLDRRTWARGLAVAVRDGLRSGDSFLPASRRPVSFPNLVYDPTRWQAERAEASTALQLPQAPTTFVRGSNAHLTRSRSRQRRAWPPMRRSRSASTASISKSATPSRWHLGSSSSAGHSKGPCHGCVSKTCEPKSMGGATLRGSSAIPARVPRACPISSRPSWPR